MKVTFQTVRERSECNHLPSVLPPNLPLTVSLPRPLLAMPGPSGAAGSQEGCSGHEPAGEYGLNLVQSVLHAVLASDTLTPLASPLKCVSFLWFWFCPLLPLSPPPFVSSLQWFRFYLCIPRKCFFKVVSPLVMIVLGNFCVCFVMVRFQNWSRQWYRQASFSMRLDCSVFST